VAATLAEVAPNEPLSLRQVLAKWRRAPSDWLALEVEVLGAAAAKQYGPADWDLSNFDVESLSRVLTWFETAAFDCAGLDDERRETLRASWLRGSNLTVGMTAPVHSMTVLSGDDRGALAGAAEGRGLARPVVDARVALISLASIVSVDRRGRERHRWRGNQARRRPRRPLSGATVGMATALTW